MGRISCKVDGKSPWKVLGFWSTPHLLHVCDHRSQAGNLMSRFIKWVSASSGFDSSLRTPKSEVR